jgi:N-acyl-D-amino-acid deacylase
MFDLIIKNGKILDGSGNPWRYDDIGIMGDNIEKIGNLSSASSREVIDAKERFVSPGFIDPHTHSDLILALDKKSQTDLMKGRVTQGITTEVIGNCGIGFAPLEIESRIIVQKEGHPFTPTGINWNWSSHEDFLNYLEKNGVTSNIIMLISHGPVRIAAMGMKADIPTKRELNKMKELVEEGMDAGAFGMSTGLIYPPGIYSRTNELIELSKIVPNMTVSMQAT